MIPAAIAPLTILIEPVSRRAELVLFKMPRFLEMLWNFLVNKGIVKNIKNGEVIMFAIAMSIICYCYQNEEDCIKPSYLNVFKRFYGEN